MNYTTKKIKQYNTIEDLSTSDVKITFIYDGEIRTKELGGYWINNRMLTIFWLMNTVKELTPTNFNQVLKNQLNYDTSETPLEEEFVNTMLWQVLDTLTNKLNEEDDIFIVFKEEIKIVNVEMVQYGGGLVDFDSLSINQESELLDAIFDLIDERKYVHDVNKESFEKFRQLLSENYTELYGYGYFREIINLMEMSNNIVRLGKLNYEEFCNYDSDYWAEGLLKDLEENVDLNKCLEQCKEMENKEGDN